MSTYADNLSALSRYNMFSRLSFSALLAVLFVASLQGAHGQVFNNPCVSTLGNWVGQIGLGCDGAPPFGVSCTKENAMCTDCECLGFKTASDATQALVKEDSAGGVGGFVAAAVAFGIAAVM